MAIAIPFDEDGTQVLVPMAAPDGSALDEPAAIEQYKKTGKHFGKFDTVGNARAYADQLSSAAPSAAADTGMPGVDIPYRETPAAAAAPPGAPALTPQPAAVPGAPAPAAAPSAVPTLPVAPQPAPDSPEARYSQTLDRLNADPVLMGNPAAHQHAVQRAEQAYRAENIRTAGIERARKQASDHAADVYVQQMIKGDMTGLVDAIGADPNLDKADRERLWVLAEQHAKNDVAGTIKTLGPGYYDVVRRMMLPDGDPSRISEPRQVLELGQPGKNGEQPWLTVPGVQRVMQEIKQDKQSPETHAIVDMKNKQLAYAKHQLSFEEDYGVFKIRDPKGEDIFNSAFVPAFYKTYEDGIKAGKDAHQLLSKGSPDYIVDKLIASYKRTDADYARDRANSGSAPAPGTPGAAAARTLPAILSDIQAGKLTPDAGKAEALRLGLIAPDRPATPPPLAVPLARGHVTDLPQPGARP